MKYKVGDKVRVKSDLKTSDPYPYGVNSDMAAMRGTVVTISRADYGKYSVKGNIWTWHDDMFEGLASSSDNYLCLNGKCVDLTEEQLKKLGIEPEKKSPFARAEHGERYYFINAIGNIDDTIDCETSGDNARFEHGNYCTDKAIMQQRALKHELMDKLEVFAIENGGIPKRGSSGFFTIQPKSSGGYMVDTWADTVAAFEPRFVSEEVAERALNEIVNPFLKAHPEFVVC